MTPSWIRRLFGREDVAEEYGNMSADERLELERLRSLAGSHRTDGTVFGGGRTFDRELDAEAGRPPR